VNRVLCEAFLADLIEEYGHGPPPQLPGTDRRRQPAASRFRPGDAVSRTDWQATRHGPQDRLYPGRLLDLDKNATAELARRRGDGSEAWAGCWATSWCRALLGNLPASPLGDPLLTLNSILASGYQMPAGFYRPDVLDHEYLAQLHARQPQG
jgi:hypothetical protein